MDVISYALTKKIAEHAVSGVNSMSVSGQTLIINTKDSGVLTMTFPTPKDGISVTDIDVNVNNQIVFTMSDGSEFISGKIPTVKGDPFTYSDFTQEQLEALKGADGFSPTATVKKVGKVATITITDINGTTTATIADGAGSGGSGEENTIESISVNGVNIAPDENKNINITVPTVTNDLTDELKSSYDDAVAAKHTHDNKTVLDGITAEKVEVWDKAEENVQSDWNETDDTADAFIKNKPIIPSLSGYATETWVNEQGFLKEHQDLSNYATKDEIPNVSGYITEEQLLAKDYADKAYVTEEIAKASTGGEIDLSSYLSKVEATETYVAKESGKSLIEDIEIERLASVDNYDDTDIRAELANKADITAIPTVDVTKSYVDTELAKKADTDHTHITVNGHTVESDVPVDAKFTDTVYDDTDIKAEIAKKADATSIPSKVSDLENDSNYLSSIPEEYVTETELNAKGYLTEHQDLSAYATKDEIPTVPSKVSELTNDSNYQTAEQVNSTVTTEIAKVVADAPEDFNTLKEMSDWIAGHENDASAMNSAILDNKTAIASLQTGKADKSEIPTTLPADGGNADTVNNHTVETDVPTDAVFTDTTYSEATQDTSGLMSTEDKKKLDGITTGAEVNQNAFSNIVVGSTAISADSKTDSLILAGSNVTITPDATNDKVTIGITKSDVTNALGYTPPTTNTTYEVATSSALGLVKSGTDITVDSSGNVSVNDDSHNHVISNIDGLQSVLDGKAAASHTHSNYLTGITKSMVTDALGYTPPTTDTNTWRPLGTGANDACAGNDSRLSDARPASDVYSWAKASSKPSYSWNEITSKPSTFTPSSHTHDDRYYTESEINTKLNAKLNTSLKGSANGLAELDANGKVLSNQLPSFVDDVVEGYFSGGKFYKETAHTTEIAGEAGKIYIDLTTNKTYRWSGSTFVVISETLSLGETSSTAYRGDRGKTAYDHSQSTHARTDATKVEKSSTNGNIKINGTETIVYTHPSGTNPHGTTKSDVGLGNVGNFKAVSTVASQGLTDTEKANARANIGAGTSSVSGSYNDLADKPTIPSVGNGTITIKQAGTSKGTFTMNQTGNTTIELTDTNTTYSEATTSSAGLMSATDKNRLDSLFQLTTYKASRASLQPLSDYMFTISHKVPTGYTTVGIVAFNLGNTQLSPIRTGWDTGNVYLQVHNTHNSAISSKFTVSVTVLYIRETIPSISE